MIHIVANPLKDKYEADCSDLFTLDNAKKVREFHKSFKEYTNTPLVSLKEYAKCTGVSAVYIKDESYRFGLQAFKVLGGSYAIGNYLNEHPKQNNLTFISATDGNHGRGVAWMAEHAGHHAVIYMPKGSAKERLDHIRETGAEAYITDFNYDKTVRYANELAEKNGWVMVQDTAWEGYTSIPIWIMQGYMTMAYEAYQQLDGICPTHIFIQAGVGSVAAAVIGFFTELFSYHPPIMVVVESEKADCLFQSARAADGKRRFVDGDMDTIMAGLACGEPNTISWELLRAKTDYFMTGSDYMAAQGMRILGNPCKGDTRVVAGESGASAFGIISEVLRNERYKDIRTKLMLDEQSCLLFFNTEGATDENNYRKIVWDGAYSKER